MAGTVSGTATAALSDASLAAPSELPHAASTISAVNDAATSRPRRTWCVLCVVTAAVCLSVIDERSTSHQLLTHPRHGSPRCFTGSSLPSRRIGSAGDGAAFSSPSLGVARDARHEAAPPSRRHRMVRRRLSRLPLRAGRLDRGRHRFRCDRWADRRWGDRRRSARPWAESRRTRRGGRVRARGAQWRRWRADLDRGRGHPPRAARPDQPRRGDASSDHPALSGRDVRIRPALRGSRPVGRPRSRGIAGGMGRRRGTVRCAGRRDVHRVGRAGARAASAAVVGHDTRGHRADMARCGRIRHVARLGRRRCDRRLAATRPGQPRGQRRLLGDPSARCGSDRLGGGRGGGDRSGSNRSHVGHNSCRSAASRRPCKTCARSSYCAVNSEPKRCAPHRGAATGPGGRWFPVACRVDLVSVCRRTPP